MAGTKVLVAGCVFVVLAVVISVDAGDMKRLLDVIERRLENTREKRGCNTYICQNSHLASKTADAAIKESLRKFLWECVEYGRCGGGRKKRDVLQRLSAMKSENSRRLPMPRDIRSILRRSSDMLNNAPS